MTKYKHFTFRLKTKRTQVAKKIIKNITFYKEPM